MRNKLELKILAPVLVLLVLGILSAGIDAIADIKGCSFAFGDINSTSGHIVPRAMLLEAGIDLMDLRYYNYLGSHEEVLRALLRGDFDAGGVMERIAQRYQDRGVKLILLSEDIPEFNICAAPGNDVAVMEDVKQAVLKLDGTTEEGARVLRAMHENYTGFAAAMDRGYNGIRGIMAGI